MTRKIKTRLVKSHTQQCELALASKIANLPDVSEEQHHGWLLCCILIRLAAVK